MKASFFTAIFLAGMFCGAPVFAEGVEGVVKVVGSALARKVMINTTDGAKYRLCDNDIAKKVSRLTGMTVQVSGDWQLRNEEKYCLTANVFSVKKVSSGRDALVGILVHTDGGYEVKGDSGKVHVFSQVPDGLKKLVDKKVIIDMKPMNTPAAQGTAYSVVTYSLYP